MQYKAILAPEKSEREVQSSPSIRIGDISTQLEIKVLQCLQADFGCGGEGVEGERREIGKEEIFPELSISSLGP